MTFETLSVEQSNGVATVTVNREQVLNAINRATLQELGDCFNNLESVIQKCNISIIEYFWHSRMNNFFI